MTRSGSTTSPGSPGRGMKVGQSIQTVKFKTMATTKARIMSTKARRSLAKGASTKTHENNTTYGRVVHGKNGVASSSTQCGVGTGSDSGARFKQP